MNMRIDHGMTRLALVLGLIFAVTLTGLNVRAERSYVLVTLQTTLGDITLEIDKEKAPETAANFLQYVEDGFYDGVIFHRVIPGFMIQGGGFDQEMKQKPTRSSIKNEADNGLTNTKYTIAMARTSDPHSAGSQFFINVADNAFLNHKAKTPDAWGYAVFGKVIAGQDVVDKIAAVPTTSQAGHRDVPKEPVLITKAGIED
jgi:peptidyl-prolyl cis-trans isomerase B (cyclophilin B)